MIIAPCSERPTTGPPTRWGAWGAQLRHDVLLRGLLGLVLVAWWWVVPRSGLGHRTTRYVRHARGWYAYGVRTVRGASRQAALCLWYVQHAGG